MTGQTIDVPGEPTGTVVDGRSVDLSGNDCLLVERWPTFYRTDISKGPCFYCVHGSNNT